MWVNVPHLSIVTGGQEQQGYSQGSQWAPHLRVAEGKTKSLQLQISECSVLLHSSLTAVHSNMPLQQEEGKTDKLDKP